MSPEQANDSAGPLGTASDVYSLGATLYHVLAGRPPIEKDDKYTMFGRARRGEFSPPRQVNPRVPAALEAVCQKAMSYGPDDRYPSPRALADEIEHWLADEPARLEGTLATPDPRGSAGIAPVAAAAAALLSPRSPWGICSTIIISAPPSVRAQADGLVVA